MATQKKRRKRAIEKNYPVKQFVKKLRRLVDCIEQGQRFQIQVAGERVSIPATAFLSMIFPVTVFFFMQRYFVKGMLAGAVKG